MNFLTNAKSTLSVQPRCTYYFGPFNNANEAETARPGYIQDLQSEGALGIVTTIKRCKPTQMTVCDDAFL
jgi:Domain of unknown function (DUF1816)